MAYYYFDERQLAYYSALQAQRPMIQRPVGDPDFAIGIVTDFFRVFAHVVEILNSPIGRESLKIAADVLERRKRAYRRKRLRSHPLTR